MPGSSGLSKSNSVVVVVVAAVAVERRIETLQGHRIPLGPRQRSEWTSPHSPGSTIVLE